jgi:hypothetical protein
MTIEILYTPGCPNYQPTVEMVNKVLASEAVAGKVSGVPVRTEGEAKFLLFPGSPTVRVNGNDIDPSPAIAPSLACRLYANGGGVPPIEMVRAMILRAKQME